MKKIYICLLMLVFGVMKLQAQSNSSAHPARWGSVGFFAGINRNEALFETNQFIPLKAHYSFLVGLDLSAKLSRHSSLHIQPSYTSIKNQKPEESYFSGTSLDIDIAKIPALYRYTFGESKITPYIEAGMGYNRAMSGVYTIRPYRLCDFISCQGDNVGNYSLSTGSALSAIAGVGTVINLNKVSIPVMIRYERYLSSYTFSSGDDLPTGNNYAAPIRFENVAIMTGINF